jgi:hypothetical protein
VTSASTRCSSLQCSSEAAPAVLEGPGVLADLPAVLAALAEDHSAPGVAQMWYSCHLEGVSFLWACLWAAARGRLAVEA